MSKTEKKEMDKIEIYALKKMIGLPRTTPTAGVIFATGAMCASIHIEMKQIIYLQKILMKEDHWTKQTLKILSEHNIGWAKQISQTLEEWGLESDWDKISKIPVNQWKTDAKEAAEKKNREKLKEELFTKSRGQVKEKTKTKSLLKIIDDSSYIRRPIEHMDKDVLVARALIMGRFGMLQCGANFEMSYGGKECKECKVTDDECHRINSCKKFESVNLCKSAEKLNYDLIYSDEISECMKVVERILMMWDLVNGKNVMRDR